MKMSFIKHRIYLSCFVIHFSVFLLFIPSIEPRSLKKECSQNYTASSGELDMAVSINRECDHNINIHPNKTVVLWLRFDGGGEGVNGGDDGGVNGDGGGVNGDSGGWGGGVNGDGGGDKKNDEKAHIKQEDNNMKNNSSNNNNIINHFNNNNIGDRENNNNNNNKDNNNNNNNKENNNIMKEKGDGYIEVSNKQTTTKIKNKNNNKSKLNKEVDNNVNNNYKGVVPDIIKRFKDLSALDERKKSKNDSSNLISFKKNKISDEEKVEDVKEEKEEEDDEKEEEDDEVKEDEEKEEEDEKEEKDEKEEGEVKEDEEKGSNMVRKRGRQKMDGDGMEGKDSDVMKAFKKAMRGERGREKVGGGGEEDVKLWNFKGVSIQFYDSPTAKEAFHYVLESDILKHLLKRPHSFLRVDSPTNHLRVVISKASTLQTIAITAHYQAKGECMSNQSRCEGEDDCFFTNSRCDVLWDCPIRGGDEIDCHGCDNNTYSCFKTKAAAAVMSSGTAGRCYSYNERCDGSFKCNRGLDEMNCNANKCNPSQGTFLCANMKCIRKEWLCDGTDDCNDLSDEVDCPDDGQSVKILVILGSLSCALLFLLIILFSLKLYALHVKSSRERMLIALEDEYIASIVGSHDTELEEEILARIHERQQLGGWWDFFIGGGTTTQQSSRSRGGGGRSDRRSGGGGGGGRRNSRERRFLWSRCYGQHISPMTHIQNEILDRLSAPPTYNVAMATSRSYNDFLTEQMLSGGYREVMKDEEEEDDDNVVGDDDDAMLDVSEDTTLLNTHLFDQKENNNNNNNRVITTNNNKNKISRSLMSWLSGCSSSSSSSINNNPTVIRDEALFSLVDFEEPPPPFEQAISDGVCLASVHGDDHRGSGSGSGSSSSGQRKSRSSEILFCGSNCSKRSSGSSSSGSCSCEVNEILVADTRTVGPNRNNDNNNNRSNNNNNRSNNNDNNNNRSNNNNRNNNNIYTDNPPSFEDAMREKELDCGSGVGCNGGGCGGGCNGGGCGGGCSSDACGSCGGDDDVEMIDI